MAIKALFVVGAGFSAHAGLPLTSDFTDALLDVERYSSSSHSVRLVNALRKFVHDIFDHNETASARHWPEMEDVFTCIDLSANTGHNLGARYSASVLRTLRRALIVRIIRMLTQRYATAAKHPDDAWDELAEFFSRIDIGSSAFLSMNWDTVVERGIAENFDDVSYNYGCDAIAAEFRPRGIALRDVDHQKKLSLIKVHGSINWLYCDVCRALFWFPPSPRQVYSVASELFRERDWTVIDSLVGDDKPRKSAVHRCPTCESRALATRLATFSYRKALDFPMHQKSWFSAEKLLRDADTWVFIGYSLPAADFEFKYLLKQVEVSRKKAPEIIVISGGTRQATDNALRNYRRFFGRSISDEDHTFFRHGLDRAVLTRLRNREILN